MTRHIERSLATELSSVSAKDLLGEWYALVAVLIGGHLLLLGVYLLFLYKQQGPTQAQRRMIKRAYDKAN